MSENSTKSFNAKVVQQLMVVSAKTDCKEPVKGSVTGTIPKWLSGKLYRNGPGIFEFGEEKYNHWFDGQALTHRFSLQNGEVSYTSEFLKTETFRRNSAAQRILVSELGTLSSPDPCSSVFERLKHRFVPDKDLTDNTMVNIFPRQDALYAITESSFLNRLNPETLEIVKREDIRNFVAVNLLTAHPHLENGYYYNMATHFEEKGGPCFKLVEIGPESTADGSMANGKVVATIPSRWRMNIAYSHSFALTENYFVFVESSLVFNLVKLMFSHALKMSVEGCMDWWPDEPARFHVIDRRTGQVLDTHYETRAFFTFHHINAYEEDDHIVMDVCAYPSGEIIHYANLVQFREPTSEEFEMQRSGEARRYVIPLRPDPSAKVGANLNRLSYSDATATFVDEERGRIVCEHDLLTSVTFDMPQVHYGARNGRKYRYAYGTAAFKVFEQLVKVDVINKTSTTWSEPDCYPGEPVFVPSPNGVEEDDGVLLSSAVRITADGSQRNAVLFVIDAKTMTELARAEWPSVSFPRDVHGFFADGW